MATVSIDRLVRHQIIFREVNERIREVVERFDSTTTEIAFICECSRPDCAESVELELDEYKAIRSSPTLFVVVPGHETHEVEVVLDTNDRFALVEKVRRVELVRSSYQPITDRPQA